ncbi:hypothetical protein PEC302110_08270 [Pectobacterium araliae]|uniref:Uncharacterized protein n=1 Tax=Pectobacterium araliae TaxID=3073862 RepID=A0AAN0MK14_9GAMM|nr:hypothetical protein PEC302110_08270 [Pectobacterium sp. MAFF 302110]
MPITHNVIPDFQCPAYTEDDAVSYLLAERVEALRIRREEESKCYQCHIRDMENE